MPDPTQKKKGGRGPPGKPKKVLLEDVGEMASQTKKLVKCQHSDGTLSAENCELYASSMTSITSYLIIFILGGLIFAHLISLCIYVYIEKPSIDARKVFKNELAES